MYKVSSIVQLVASTDLVGIVPRRYAEQASPQYGLQIFDLPLELSNQQFHLIWHKRAAEDEGIKWLREKIKSCFAQNQQNQT